MSSLHVRPSPLELALWLRAFEIQISEAMRIDPEFAQLLDAALMAWPPRATA